MYVSVCVPVCAKRCFHVYPMRTYNKAQMHICHIGVANIHTHKYAHEYKIVYLFLLSTYLPAYLHESIDISLYRYIDISIYLPIYLSNYLSNLCTFLITYLLILLCRTICLSNYPSIYYLSVCQFVYLRITGLFLTLKFYEE